MSKIVIFSGSYPQIKNALYIATNSCPDCSVTLVIPGLHDLFKFFQVINERLFHNTINLIYLERYQARRAKAKGINKIFYVLPDIIKERRHLKQIFDKYFAELKGAEIFFSSRCFCPYTFYLLKRLSKGNKLVHICDPSMDGMRVEKFTPTNIIDWATLIVLKLVYGRGITMGKLPYTKFPCMSDKFFNREVDKVIDREERNELMKGFDVSRFKIFNVGNYSVIYFDDSLLEAGCITGRDVFKVELSEIFNILSKYFPEKEIARKYHPGYPGDKTMIKTGDVLPDFIPAELLYNDNVKMYLSLFSISIANVEKGLAVSIADLITFKDEKTKNQLKERQIQRSKSKILFPKSLDEFERIVVKVAKGQNGKQYT